MLLSTCRPTPLHPGPAPEVSWSLRICRCLRLRRLRHLIAMLLAGWHIPCATTCSFHVFLIYSFSQNRVGFRAQVLRVKPLHNLMQSTRKMWMWMGVLLLLLLCCCCRLTMDHGETNKVELNGKFRLTLLIWKHQHTPVHPVFHCGTKHYHQDSRSKISIVRSSDALRPATLESKL